jgi:hypothetical protein
MLLPMFDICGQYRKDIDILPGFGISVTTYTDSDPSDNLYYFF